MQTNESYPIVERKKPAHGNTKTALPFHNLEVGEGFEIPPEDYGRTNSARAHFQKKHKKVKISSNAIRSPDDNRIMGYLFRREK